MQSTKISKEIHLSSGHKMPTFGLGTFDFTADHSIITQAIDEIGYRMLDCASYYGTEELVGQAIGNCKTERKDLFILSKVCWTEVEDCRAACQRSLKRLGVEYLDLYLVHFPLATRKVTNEDSSESFERIKIPMHKIWAQMEALVKEGLVRSIGVSNFNVQLLWDLMNYAEVMPVVNEVELHPLLTQDNLLKFMAAHNIAPIAYCPLARGSPAAMDSPIVKEVALKHGTTPGQILLSFGLHRNSIMVPKSQSADRLKQNFESQSINLDEDDMRKISSLNTGFRVCN